MPEEYRHLIEETFKKNNGEINKTMRELGISYQTLCRFLFPQRAKDNIARVRAWEEKNPESYKARNPKYQKYKDTKQKKLKRDKPKE